MLTVTTVNLARMGSEARAGFAQWVRRSASDVVCVVGAGGERGQRLRGLAEQAGWHTSANVQDEADEVTVFTREVPETWQAGFDTGLRAASGRYVEVTLKDVVVGGLYLPPGAVDPLKPVERSRLLHAMAVYLGELRARAEAGSKEVLLCGTGNLLEHADDDTQRSDEEVQPRTRLAQSLREEGYADVVGAVGLPSLTGEPRFPNYQVATPALVERALTAWTETLAEHAESWSEGAAVTVQYDL
jgi:exodeoxyribonuclease-3